MTFQRQCVEDAEFIIETVTEVHPRPDFRTGSAGLRSAAEAFVREARRCEDVPQFWYAAQRLMARIGDAHTAMMPLKSGMVCPPVRLDLVSGEVVVGETAPEFGTILQRGDVVLFVDSVEARYRLGEVLSLIPFDSFNWGLREAAARLLDFPEDRKERVLLTVARGTGQIVNVELPLMKRDSPEMRSWQNAVFLRDARKTVEWSVLDCRIGYLRYALCHDRTSPRFVSEAENKGVCATEIPVFRDVVSELFEEVRSRKLGLVVVDLRGNSGGNSEIARPLFNYLCRGPIRSYGVLAKVSRRVQEALSLRWRSMYPPNFEPWVRRYLEAAPGTFIEVPRRILEFPYDGTQFSDEWCYEGPLFVLVDSGTFSSGECLAAELMDNGIGTFVGEPTGGGGDVPGDQIDFETPWLKLRFAVSHKLFTRPDRTRAFLPAVVPHHFVPQSLEDYRRGNDTVLTWLRCFS